MFDYTPVLAPTQRPPVDAVSQRTIDLLINHLDELRGHKLQATSARDALLTIGRSGSAPLVAMAARVAVAESDRVLQAVQIRMTQIALRVTELGGRVPDGWMA